MLLPASVLALSAGMVMYGCEDPAEVSEEELMVETIDELEGADGPEPAQGDERDRTGAPDASAAPGGGGWKKNDDDHGGGWKKNDDDHGGGWKKDDDDHGGGWKKNDDH